MNDKINLSDIVKTLNGYYGKHIGKKITRADLLRTLTRAVVLDAIADNLKTYFEHKENKL